MSSLLQTFKSEMKIHSPLYFPSKTMVLHIQFIKNRSEQDIYFFSPVIQIISNK